MKKIWQTTPKAQMPNPVELWSFGDNSAMLSLVGAGSLCRGHHHHPKLGWEPKTPRDAWLGQRCDCDKSGFAQNCFGRAETWRSGRKGTWGYLYSGCSRAAMFDQGPLPGGTLSTQRHTHSLAHSVCSHPLQNNPLWGWAEGQMCETGPAWLGTSIGGMSWGGKIQHNSGPCSWSISLLCANAELAQAQFLFQSPALVCGV